MSTPDKRKEQNKTYYQTHKERIKAWREANKDTIREYQNWYWLNVTKKKNKDDSKIKKKGKKPTEIKIISEKPKPVQQEDATLQPKTFEIKYGTYFLSFD